MPDMLFTGQRCRIILDDAVKVLTNLTFISKGSQKTYTKTDVEIMVGHGVQHALAAFEKCKEHEQYSHHRETSRNNGNNEKQMLSHRSLWNERTRPEPDLCYDCRDSRHRYGDLERKRIRISTKKVRSEAQSRKISMDGKKDHINRDFYKASYPSQLSHLEHPGKEPTHIVFCLPRSPIQ